MQIDLSQSSSEFNRRNFFLLIRLILVVLVFGLCIFELFLSFRGLNSPAAMDQAQVARQIARGEGATTKFLRPIDILDQQKLVKAKAPKGQKDKAAPDFSAFPDTYNAPIHTHILAAALRATGYHRFEEVRMDSEISNIYMGDRIVAGVSMVFFLISLILAYFLFSAIFDEVLASTVVAFMGLSQLMLRFAVSGLAQPLLMCELLAAAFFIVAAVRSENRGTTMKTILFNFIVFGLLALMSHSHPLGAWCLIGYTVFSMFAFHPRGMFGVLGLLVLVMLVYLPESARLAPMGGPTAKFLHSIYSSFGSDNAELLMRSSSNAAVPFSNSNFFLRLLGYLFARMSTLYAYMGGIVVTPFFILALFNKYKRYTTEQLKWAVCAMWLAVSIGMTCFGHEGEMDEDQLFIIFAPFFAAYGTALVFNFLARLRLDSGFAAVRALTIFFMLLLSCGAFMFELPKELSFSILTSARGIPQYPPYYPPALNGKLCDMSNPHDIIVTDQPWAVAWYADRKALWLPRSIDTYTQDIEPLFTKSGHSVQGFLITPTSHGMTRGGMSGIASSYADFAPLVMEGKLLQLAPKHNMAFAELFNSHGNSQVRSKTLANLVSSQGEYHFRNFLLGADIVYYSKTDVSDAGAGHNK